MEHPAIPTTRFVERRLRLQNMMHDSILLMGNCESPRNFPANTLPFRQDSTFWYYTVSINPMPLGFPVRQTTFYFYQHNTAMSCGMDHMKAMMRLPSALGFNLETNESLHAFMQQHSNVHSIAVADIETNQWLSGLLGMDMVFGNTTVQKS